MIYKGTELKYFEDIFNYALKLANENNVNESNEFRKAYINYILKDAPDINTLEEAEKRMISNLGYYAGYYGDDVRKLINKYYMAVHPIFGNNYNVTPEEAYKCGQQDLSNNQN